MPDRWVALCRRLAPESVRASAFDPALADLECQWASTGAPRWRRRLQVARLAWQCRRVARRAVAPSGPGGLIPRERLMMWLRDVRLACRRLGRQPLFTLAAVLTLALGIGTNLAVSSLAYTYLIAPIPVDEPDRLVRVLSSESRGQTTLSVSYPNFADGRAQTTSIDLAAHAQSLVQVGDGDAVETRSAELVSGNYFRVLRLVPTAGRFIDDRDNEAELAHPVVVLSEAYWRLEFQARPDAIGKTLAINGTPFEIVGVAPAGFRGTFSARVVDLWVPLAMQQAARPRGLAIDRRGWGWLLMIGRLADGVTLEAAQADLDLAAADINRRFPPQTEAGAFQFVATPATAIGTADRTFLGPVLLTTLAFTGLLFLVTCANLAGMMHARMTGRRHELSVRQALGAGRGRLLAEWLTECLVLALAGGAVALVAARGAVGLLARLRPPEQIAGDLALAGGFDWRIAVYAVGLALLASLLFGLAPALRVSRRGPLSALTDRGGSATAGRIVMRMRRSAVVVQLALSGVLLLSATLLGSSLVNQQGFDVGFETERLGLLAINLERRNVPAAVRPALVESALERIRRDPDVRAADLTTSVPLGGGSDATRFDIPGVAPPEDGLGWRVNFNGVGPDYFDALGVPFVSGGTWPAVYVPGAPRPAVINETMARRFWDGRTPVGQTIQLRGGGPVVITGVVQNTVYFSVGEEPVPFIYLATGPFPPGSFVVLVRTSGEPGAVLGRLRTDLAAFDVRLRPEQVATFEEMRRVPLFPSRLLVGTSIVFGVLAFVLAGIGLYGVVSMSVGDRTREIGIRIALGARPATVLGGVLREALMLAALGLAVVLVAGYLVAGLLDTFLFGVGTFDVRAYGFVAGLLAALALLAAWLPARRAADTDPVEALRQA